MAKEKVDLIEEEKNKRAAEKAKTQKWHDAKIQRIKDQHRAELHMLNNNHAKEIQALQEDRGHMVSQVEQSHKSATKMASLQKQVRLLKQELSVKDQRVESLVEEKK